MDGYSVSIKQEQIEKLKEIFPEVVTEGKVDWEKLKATLSEDINFANERYVLNWAGKSDAFKALDVQTSATLKPVPEESINFDTTQNIFIEGENLEVLKVLRKSYYGKIKCIIIDPPYNTGNDFVYTDNFKSSRLDYEKKIGYKDSEGNIVQESSLRRNSRDSGHFHSQWLSMMYPRLFLAKNLLSNDGVIFIHIDDNEIHNLRLVMNEIFGEENFIVQIIWRKRSTPPNDQIIGANHEYILAFAKDINKVVLNLKVRSQEQVDRYKNPDNHPKGPWTPGDLMANVKGGRYVESLHFPILNPKNGQQHFPSSNGNWRFNKEKVEELIKSNEIYFGDDDNGRPKLKRFLSEVKDGVTYSSIWNFVPFNSEGSKEMAELMGNMNIFDNPKPTGLLKELLQLGSSSNSIILDFFGGSGSTAHATLQLNQEDGGKRKFIVVQLDADADINSEASKAGYKTISEITKERIRRVIGKLQTSNGQNTSLGIKVFKLSPSNFKVWRGDEITEDNLVQQLEAFTNPVKEESNETNMLYELLIKAGYLLTDKVENKGAFYSINDGEMIIALKEMNSEITTAILAAKPKKVLTLDNLFAGNDQLKTNTVLQMRDAGIDFKTI